MNDQGWTLLRLDYCIRAGLYLQTLTILQCTCTVMSIHVHVCTVVSADENAYNIFDICFIMVGSQLGKE